ncbi:MAG: hypothetical protein IJE41_02455 [Clostridia bacterium]|nr:hypothetical protein [Clostridia bacterium]
MEKECWKSTQKDMEDIVAKVKNGRVSSIDSAGGRKVYIIAYGEENDLKRKANYSSACGARDISCYADKNSENYRPTALVVGGMHGAECEGVMASLNLISLLESGTDLKGDRNDALLKSAEGLNLYIIPCANPDGRARFPYQSAVGMSLKDFRYYAQGTWKDGSLCNWPECKRVHPIIDAADYLGAYYNDDGINMMHDNFSFPMAEETKFLLKMADKLAPDITLLLHGCADARSELLMPRAVHNYFKNKAYELSQRLFAICNENKLPLTPSKPLYGDEEPIHSFNIVSAITSLCGELCVVYESNQGLLDDKGAMNSDDIYRQHMLMFETVFDFITEKRRIG